MLRFTTNVTSSPTASRRSESASAATASRAGPSAVASARYSSSVQPAGSRSAERSAASTSVSMRSGARAASSPTFSRMDSQSPNALSRSLRVSVSRPSVSIAACRSMRPSDSDASSGSCQGRPTGLTSSAKPVSGSASAATWPCTRGIDPRGAGLHVLRLGGQPLHQVVARLGGDRGQLVQCGHGRSGLTWSGVSGDTPPQSSTPAPISARHSSRDTRFGGAWMRILGPSTSRATATVARNSSMPASGVAPSRCGPWPGSSARSLPGRARTPCATCGSRAWSRRARSASRRCRPAGRW